jgi:hypothetical protein
LENPVSSFLFHTAFKARVPVGKTMRAPLSWIFILTLCSLAQAQPLVFFGNASISALFTAAPGFFIAQASDRAYSPQEINAFATDGKALFNEKRYAESLILFQRACDGNDLVSCIYLGIQYDNGLGVTENSASAVEPYKKACLGDFAQGCSNLGLLLENGRGVSVNLKLARDLYEMSCGANLEQGCFNLGSLYYASRGVEQDFARAAALFQKSCDLGYAAGCSSLAPMYMRGEGVRKDKKTAKALLAKSCSLGDSQSCAPAPQRLSFSDVLNMALPALNAMADSNSNSNSGSSSASASSSAYSSASAQNSRSSGGSNVAFLKNQIQRLQNEIARNEKNVSEWESSKTGNPAAIAGLRRSIQKEREQLLGFQAQLARAQQ